MSLIAWKDEFSVGVKSVDLEHRQLIDLINSLHGMIGDNASAEDVSNMLGEVFAQVSAHFALEERYMRETLYPHYPHHKDDHERLLDEIRDIMDRVEDFGAYDEVALSDELSDWFTNHFRTHDALLHQRQG